MPPITAPATGCQPTGIVTVVDSSPLRRHTVFTDEGATLAIQFIHSELPSVGDKVFLFLPHGSTEPLGCSLRHAHDSDFLQELGEEDCSKRARAIYNRVVNKSRAFRDPVPRRSDIVTIEDRKLLAEDIRAEEEARKDAGKKLKRLKREDRRRQNRRYSVNKGR